VHDTAYGREVFQPVTDELVDLTPACHVTATHNNSCADAGELLDKLLHLAGDGTTSRH
jgi:hypothetical protein